MKGSDTGIKRKQIEDNRTDFTSVSYTEIRSRPVIENKRKEAEDIFIARNMTCDLTARQNVGCES